MSGNWQHKISQLDIPPPPEVWNKVAKQLDEEYDSGEVHLAQKLYDFEMSPPAFLLDKVMNETGADTVPARKAKIFTLPSKRVAIAVLIVGLVAVTLFYFVQPGSSPDTQESAATILPSLPRPQPGSSTLPGRNDIDPPNSMREVQQSALDVPDERKPASRGSNDPGDSRNVKYASLGPVSANTISPISVSAPPIYDGNGNIIMDEDLVSAPDENYIIVTSPNGEQTKISRKFLKMLCVMNGGTDDYYINAENFEWKIRFEEWRSKLLQQGSYIPTANNFLGIMDFKELLQEN